MLLAQNSFPVLLSAMVALGFQVLVFGQRLFHLVMVLTFGDANVTFVGDLRFVVVFGSDLRFAEGATEVLLSGSSNSGNGI